MVTTVVLLVIYLSQHNRPALYFSVAAYVLIAANFALFRWIARWPQRVTGSQETTIPENDPGE